MRGEPPAIQFVLYSEDRADANQDFAVLREILLGMLKHLRADLKTNHVFIKPLAPVPSQRICASHWKTTAKAKCPRVQQYRRDLIIDVATEIRLGRVVFFHVDADEIWSRRDTCPNACDHWPRSCRDVQTVLAQRAASDQPAPLEHSLVLAMPFYELESWAFANTTHLRRILVQPVDIAALSGWEADLGRLEEIEHTKDILTIRDSRNAELVQIKNGFPVAMLAKVPRSYAGTLDRLRGSGIVVRGLGEAASRPF